MRAAAALIAVAVLAPWGVAEADARSWAVEPEASDIAFNYTQDGRQAEGAFRHVEGEGVFDPDDPEATRLELRIQSRSLDLGDPRASAFALSAEWFDAGNFPVARYRLARLTPLGGDHYEALGDLTIKGRTRIVRIPLTLSFDDGAARAVGEVAFDRTEFGVGTGVSSLFVEIGAEVSVAFDIVARPQ